MIITQYHQIRLMERDAETAERLKDIIAPETSLDVDKVKVAIEKQLDESDAEVPLYKILVDVEIYCITRALNLAKGNRAGAARILGLNRTTLVEKLKKWCIQTEDDLSDFSARDDCDLDFDPTKTSYLMELQWLTL
jgi:DNA-binding protein Fis